MYGRAPPPPPVEAGIPPIPSSRPIRSIPIPPTPSSSAPTSASASSSSFHTLVSPSTTSHLISPQNATSSQWMSSPLHKYHDHSSTTILPSTHHKPISRCVQYKRHIIIGCVTLAIILAIVIGVVIGTQSSSSSSSSSSTTPVIDTANANNNNNNGAQGNTQTPGTTNAPTSIPTPSTTTPTPTKPVTSAPTTQVTPKPVATSPPNTGATSSPVTKAPTTADWVGAHGIAYTGGAVMFNPVTMWLVFYGSWEATNPALTIIPQFVKDLPGSPYWSIVSTYYSVHNSTVNGVLTSERKYVSSSLTYGGMTVAAPYDPFIKTTLVDSDVYYILRNAITQGKLNPSKAIDQNAVYILITSKDIKQGTQCDTTCGWHTSAGAMRYGWVGDSSTQCPTKCQPKSSIALTPNGDRPSDSMVSMVAHELIETVVGPGVDSWQNAGTVECADICAWNYLTTYTAPNGGTANLKMNGHDYLVQSIWVNKKGGYCGLST